MSTSMLLLTVIALGILGGRFIYLSVTDWVCSTQLYEYKKAYLKAVLRQGGCSHMAGRPGRARLLIRARPRARPDVGWYDTSNPEELATKFAEAMVKVKKGFAGQAFALFEGFGYGMGGFCMAFYFAWDVALVTLAAVPLLIIPASIMMHIIENGAKTVTKAYGKAGGIAAG